MSDTPDYGLNVDDAEFGNNPPLEVVYVVLDAESGHPYSSVVVEHDDPPCAPDEYVQEYHAYTPDDRPFTRHRFDSLNPDEWTALLKMYRTVRIRVPIDEPGTIVKRSAGWPTMRHPDGGYYGKSRAEARRWLNDIARELDWYAYLGSK